MTCPHCGREVSASMAIDYRRSHHRVKRIVWLGFAAIVPITLAVLGYVYRGRLLSAFDLLAEGVGGNATAAWTLAGVLVLLLWVAVWIFFPIFVYLELKHLGRRAAELDETARLCLRHLARLSAPSEVPGNGKPREDQTSATGPSNRLADPPKLLGSEFKEGQENPKP